MSVCLKNLEERKEEEDGNRRSIEQAVKDVKVKCGLFSTGWLFSKGRHFLFSVAIQRPSHLLSGFF